MGKYYRTEVEDETSQLDLTPQTLVVPVAKVIAEAVREGIRGIGVQASAATKRYRAEAARAFERGATWARARYDGRKPNTTDRAFNDSGELAAGITAVAGEDRGTWNIDGPANRFERDDVGGRRMFERLLELVPALRDPASTSKVRDALEKVAEKVVSRGPVKRTTY